jgi:hypothetical protein
VVANVAETFDTLIAQCALSAPAAAARITPRDGGTLDVAARTITWSTTDLGAVASVTTTATSGARLHLTERASEALVDSGDDIHHVLTVLAEAAGHRAQTGALAAQTGLPSTASTRARSRTASSRRRAAPTRRGEPRRRRRRPAARRRRRRQRRSRRRRPSPTPRPCRWCARAR